MPASVNVKRPWFLICFIAIIVVLLMQLPLCRSFVLTQVGSFLIYQDNITPADAVLVLGGGERERVEQGIELVKKKYSDWIMFTGDPLTPVFGDTTHWALEAQKLAVSRGISKDKTIPIINSDSTRDDALLSKKICASRHFKSLIVVSVPYHTKRAHFVFNKVYKGSGVKIMFYPVQASWFERSSWWKQKPGFWAVNIEYQKMLYYLIKGYLI